MGAEVRRREQGGTEGRRREQGGAEGRRREELRWGGEDVEERARRGVLEGRVVVLASTAPSTIPEVLVLAGVLAREVLGLRTSTTTETREGVHTLVVRLAPKAQ